MIVVACLGCGVNKKINLTCQECGRLGEREQMCLVTPEEWRTLHLSADYEVSSHGRFRRSVLSKDRNGSKAGTILRPGGRRDGGYLTGNITVCGRRIGFSIHSAIAIAFIGPRPEGFEVNHIDGDKLNPAAWNLEYATKSRNKMHAIKTGLHKKRFGADSHAAKYTAEQVKEMFRMRSEGLQYKDIAEAVVGTRDYYVAKHIGCLLRGEYRPNETLEEYDETMNRFERLKVILEKKNAL